MFSKAFALIALVVGLNFTTQISAQNPGPNTPVPPQGSIQGNTRAEIHQRFAGIIEQNFRSAATAGLVDKLQDVELTSLATHYRNETQGKTMPLLTTFAKNLPASTLVRVAGAFGYQEIATAVARSAPQRVAEFTAAATSANINTGVPPLVGNASSVTIGGSVGFAGPAPTTDMTLEEVYLEFRTAPVGSLSVTSGLVETGIFAGRNLVLAYSAGYAFGTGVSWLIQKYAPSVDNAIGAGVAAVVDGISQATTEFLQGQAEQRFDSLLGSPVEQSNDYYGDWSDSQSMGDWMDSGGGGGGGCGSEWCLNSAHSQDPTIKREFKMAQFAHEMFELFIPYEQAS